MRLIFFYFLLLSSLSGFSQTREYYLDYKDDKCDSSKAWLHRKMVWQDSIWDVNDYYVYNGQLQMQGYCTGDDPLIDNGKFTFYYENGQVSVIKYYKDGKQNGLNTHYYENGQPLDSVYHINDMYAKFFYKWNKKGELMAWGDYDDLGNGSAPYVWGNYENGNRSYEGKKSAGDFKDSTWNYYYKTGELSSREYYTRGKLDKRECFDIYGKKKKCKDKGGKILNGRQVMEELKEKYESKLNTNYTKNKPRFVADMCIDEDGKLSITIIQHTDPELEKIILEAVNSLELKPAIRFGRPEKTCDTFHYDF